MSYRSSIVATRRLPRRSRRQRLAFVGITLTICAVFWGAIFWAHRDPDPRLYERLVPVTIVLPGDRTAPPRSTAGPASGAGR